jgi:RHS repeat-associated protein
VWRSVCGVTCTQGYPTSPNSNDGVRQKLTQKERDIETGLDYFLARYYSSVQGRFTSADPVFFQAAMTIDPQRFNLYAYTRNNPLRFIDPEGEAIELEGDEEQRRQQLEAARLAVGKQAGTYLYENKGKDGKYYVGVYTNGPDGKGKDFKDLNEVAGEFAAIIQDQKVATIETVAVGTVVNGEHGKKVTLAPNDKCNCVAPGTESAFAITINGADQNHFRILLPMPASGSDIEKAGIDSLDPILMSNDKPGKNDWGIILAHDMGHARARMTGDPDSKGASLRLENKVRALRDKNAPTRTYHDVQEAQRNTTFIKP